MRPSFIMLSLAVLLIDLAACSPSKPASFAAPLPPLRPPSVSSSPETEGDANPNGGTITGLKLVKKLNVPAGPKSLRVLPDGKRVMTCNLYGHQVTFIDAKTYEILQKVPVGGEPVECTFTKGGKYAWVSLYGSERVGVTSVVVVIDTETYQIVARIPAGRVPKVVAESPDGKWVYAANWLSESITVMDAEKINEGQGCSRWTSPPWYLLCPRWQAGLHLHHRWAHLGRH
ncbi:MAG: YncE family protein [Acidobacteriota bacterium]